MHVLLIPIKYPSSYKRQSHVFFEEQARALSLNDATVGVLAVIPVSLRQMWKQKKIDLGSSQELVNGVQLFRYQYPVIPKMWRFNSWLQTRIGKHQFLRYQKKHGAPDIVHVHVSLAGKVAIWISRTFQIPYVVTEHYTSFIEGNMPSWQKELAGNVFTHSKKNIAVSKEFAVKLQHDYHLDFEYIPNIVDTGVFTPHPQRGPMQSVRNFLNIGNLYRQKNQGMLIRAFSRAFKGEEDFKLVIAGSGPEYSRLKKIASELNMQKQISFFGQANRGEVAALMQDSDCFVLSSRYETFGVVVIEAMSCGLPVIATRSGGPESIITEEKLGMLCDIDEDQLTDALSGITKNRYDSDYIRKYALANFSSEIIATRLKDLYLQVLNRDGDIKYEAGIR